MEKKKEIIDSMEFVGNDNPEIELIIQEEFNKLCPPDVEEIRKFVTEFKNQDYNFSEGFVAQGYAAARKSKSASGMKIAKLLGINYLDYKYYMSNYPKFAAAIRMGMIDGKEDAKAELIDSVYKRAVGVKLKETRITKYINKDGQETTSKSVSIKELPPEPSAAIELLKRLDPEWKKDAEVNINNITNINTVGDITFDIDYRKLSANAIRELLQSQKTPKNTEALVREDGKSVVTVVEETIKTEKEENNDE